MKVKTKIIDAANLLLGTFLVASAINIFFVPNKISTGGASGVGIILYYLYEIPVSFWVLVINIPLFIISLKELGFKFCLKALIGTGLLIILLEVTTPLKEYINISNDLFIASIFGGLINGLGLSLVFRADGSTGGSDLLAQIIYKKRSASSIGSILLVIDTFVIVANAIVFNSITTALYSVVALYISKQTTDIVFEGVNYTKAVNIITKKGEEIAKEILEKTERGVTISECIGIYTGEKYTHVISVMTIPQLPKVKRIVKEIDRTAFVYISNTNEVLGLGFKENK